MRRKRQIEEHLIGNNFMCVKGGEDVGTWGVFVYTVEFGERKACWIQSTVYFPHSPLAISHQSTALLN